MQNDFYVYAWRRPDTGEVFYIGKGRGKRDVSLKRSNPLFMRVIAKLKRHGLASSVERLHERLSEADAFRLERDEIARYGRRDNGTGSLTNLTDGGEGRCGSIASVETKAKQGAALKGIPRTAEWLKRMGASLAGNQNARGAVRSPETRQRMSAAQKLKPASSAETREKISASVTAVVRAAPPRVDNTSGFKGVSYCRDRDNWQVGIGINGKRRSLGRYPTAEAAARAYDVAALSAWGPDCYLNFPASAANDNSEDYAIAA